MQYAKRWVCTFSTGQHNFCFLVFKIQINKCVWGWWVQFQGYSREKPLCREQRESDEDLRCAESYRGLDGLSEEINQ